MMRILTLLFISFTFFSCDETVEITDVIREIEKNVEVSKALPIPQPASISQAPENELLVLIRKNLPRLEKGMSTDEVFEMLYLDSKFNGIVTSDGRKDDFTFYYELKDGYELILSFDYTSSKFGELINFSLHNNS